VPCSTLLLAESMVSTFPHVYVGVLLTCQQVFRQDQPRICGLYPSTRALRTA
jgi:hypothetical protein